MMGHRKIVEKELLGTIVRVIGDVDSSNAFDECKRIQEAFSRFVDGNELSNLNADVGHFYEVSEEMLNLLSMGLEVSRKTSGAFNMAIESLLSGWGYNKEYSFKDVGGGSVGGLEIDGKKVRITAPLDLGGLGKGYALGRMVEILKEQEQDFCVDAGGDIYAQGRGWKVAFEHPLKDDEGIGTVEVDGFYLASSNGKKRKWGDKHHLVNPLSGEPAKEMLAVYVQGDGGALVDAYSTALFVMGFKDACNAIKDLPVEAMFVGIEGNIFRSEGFKGELFLD